MRKAILATTAMAAAGLMAGNAVAQVEVTLGGEVRFQAGYVLSESNSLTGSSGMGLSQELGKSTHSTQGEIDNNTSEELADSFGADLAERSGSFNSLIDNINIGISATADNGLSYGGNARIAGGADRARFYVSGAFGRVELGDWGSAADALNTQVPHSGRGRFSGDIDNYIFNAGIANGGVAAGGGNKIVYKTEGTALDDTGLTIALSYAPTSGGTDDDPNRTRTQFNDVGSIAVKYEQEFNGVTVRGAGGYEFGTTHTTTTVGNGGDFFVLNDNDTDTRSNRNLSAFNLGAGLAFGGFDVGVHYVDRGASGQISGFSDRTWSAGATYSVGPWAFGVSYADGRQSVSVEGEDSGSTTRANYSVDEQRLGLGATFDVAPGLVVAGDLGYNHSQWAASGHIDADENLKFQQKSWVGLVTTRLSF